jgi:hypothetical protein
MSRKVHDEIQKALDAGDLKTATLIILKETRSNGMDLLTILAVAKATELMSLGKDRIADLVSKQFIPTTPVGYIYEESVKHAQHVSGIAIDDNDRRILEIALKETIASSLDSIL